MMPTVSPDLMCKSTSFRMGSPLPSAWYLNMTWLKSIEPSLTVSSGCSGFDSDGSSFSTSTIRRADAADMVSMTKIIDSIIRFISMFMT